MDQARKLAAVAKLAGGVVFRGELYISKPAAPMSCEGCAHRDDNVLVISDCTSFRRVAAEDYDMVPSCLGRIWIKAANLKP